MNGVRSATLLNEEVVEARRAILLKEAWAYENEYVEGSPTRSYGLNRPDILLSLLTNTLS